MYASVRQLAVSMFEDLAEDEPRSQELHIRFELAKTHEHVLRFCGSTQTYQNVKPWCNDEDDEPCHTQSSPVITTTHVNTIATREHTVQPTTNPLIAGVNALLNITPASNASLFVPSLVPPPPMNASGVCATGYRNPDVVIADVAPTLITRSTRSKIPNPRAQQPETNCKFPLHLSFKPTRNTRRNVSFAHDMLEYLGKSGKSVRSLITCSKKKAPNCKQ